MQKYIINKFGGAIMSSKETLNCAKKNLIQQKKEGFTPVSIVSAFEGVTDELVKLSKSIETLDKINVSSDSVRQYVDKIIEANTRILNLIDFDKLVITSAHNEIQEIYESLRRDVEAAINYGMLDIFHGKILSYGEKISSIYFKYFLEIEADLSAERFSGEEIGIVTNQKFLDASIGFEISSKKVSEKIKSLSSDKILIITGFSGKTPSGQTSTLGRGGSDTSATFIGAALNAIKIILWKNVAGVLSADPRIVNNAKIVKNISYSQAEESGKVICVKAMKYIRMSKIPCEVTYICDESQKTVIKQSKSQKQGLKLVSIKKDLILLKFKDESIVRQGFLRNVTEILGELDINMVLIRNTKETMYIVIDRIERDKFENTIKLLKKKYLDSYFEKISIIVGIGNFKWKDVRMFNDVIYNSKLNIEIGAFPYNNNVRLEAVIIGDDTEIEKVLNELHKKLIT